LSVSAQLPSTHRETMWLKRLRRCRERAKEAISLVVEGRLTRMVGLTIEAVGCQIAIGGRCLIRTVEGRDVEAEVVGFSESSLYLMPVGSTQGVAPNARVVPTHRGCEAAVGPALLGRVLDATGTPLDGKGSLPCDQRVALTGQPLNPLSRGSIHEPLDVGVRSINALTRSVVVSASGCLPAAAWVRVSCWE
jgi:flagellum-specific ATP synthase